MSLPAPSKRDCLRKSMVSKGIEQDLTEAEAKLLHNLKEIAWGRVQVVLKNGQPVLLTRIEKDVKLD